MAVNIKVPEELYRKAAEIAAAEHASVEDVFASAFVEQVTAWERLQERAERGDRERFFRVLAKAEDSEPEPQDHT